MGRSGFRGARHQESGSALRDDQGEFHRRPRGAHEKLAHRLVVEGFEVDLGEHDVRRGLALEAVNRLAQHLAFGEERVAEQVVLAGEAPQAVGADLVEAQQLRVLAPAPGQHGHLRALEPGRQSLGERLLGLVDHAARVGIAQDLDLRPRKRAAALDGIGQELQLREAAQDVRRRAVVGVRAQGDPAGQGEGGAAVEVLHRIFQPPGPSLGGEQAQQVGQPFRAEVLPFVDDQFVEAPVIRGFLGGEAVLEQREGIGLREVDQGSLRAQHPVAQLVVGGDFGPARRQQGHVVGEGAVVADVERTPSGVDGILQGGQRELALARSGGANDAHAEGAAVDAAAPGGEPARQADVQFLDLARDCPDLGGEGEFLAKESFHAVGQGGWGVERDDGADDRDQVVLPAGIDDAGGVEAGDVGAPDRVVRAVEQHLGAQLLAAVLAEPVLEALHVAVELVRYLFFGSAVLLDESAGGLLEETGLLLDQEHVPARGDDGEVDLAEDRGPVLDARPVDAMEDRVVVGQVAGEAFEGFQFALEGAGRLHRLPVGGDDFGHGYALRMAASSHEPPGSHNRCVSKGSWG